MQAIYRVDGDREHIVVVEHAAGFVDHRKPVAVGVLPESDVALFFDDEL